MVTLHVTPGSRPANGAPITPTPRRVMTRLGSTERNSTFRAPVTRPGADSRKELWTATSHDGMWRYDRIDDGATSPWMVTYQPTGQRREGYGTITAARQHTADGLLLELRREAFTAAFTGPADGRGEGQRWLAVHMRMAGPVEPERRCACGGMLVQATRDGRLAHVDACHECLTEDGRVDAGTVCEHADAHLFCGDPRPVECGHHGDDRLYGRCGLDARPNRGQGCGRGLTVDCCAVCCHDGGE